MARHWLRQGLSRLLWMIVLLGFGGLCSVFGQGTGATGVASGGSLVGTLNGSESREGAAARFSNAAGTVYGSGDRGSEVGTAGRLMGGTTGFTAAAVGGSGVSLGGRGIQWVGYGIALFVLVGAGVVMAFRGGLFGGLGSGGRGVRKLQIEETRMLGHRQYLVVAQYEGRRMLLGVCPGRIDYLCPLDWEGEAGGKEGSFLAVGEEGAA
jgi:hypothetical protein